MFGFGFFSENSENSNEKNENIIKNENHESKNTENYDVKSNLNGEQENSFEKTIENENFSKENEVKPQSNHQKKIKWDLSSYYEPENLKSNNKNKTNHTTDNEEDNLLFKPETPSATLEDLIVPSETKTQINTALNKIKYRKTLYEDWGLNEIDNTQHKIILNLYGKPGTGKSLCAEGIADYFGKKIIRVNYSEIESKYVGETSKNITAAFERAKETGSVLLFDEADSILGKRLTEVRASGDHAVNSTRAVTLMQMEKFNGIVVLTTNLAKNYDSAFVRRITHHIEFKMPDLETRNLLWNKYLISKIPKHQEVTTSWLASESEDLSGADIKQIVIETATMAVARVDKRFVTTEDFKNSIKNRKKAKQEVGNSRKQVKTTEKTFNVNDKEVPKEIKNKAKEVINKPENNIVSP